MLVTSAPARAVLVHGGGWKQLHGYVALLRCSVYTAIAPYCHAPYWDQAIEELLNGGTVTLGIYTTLDTPPLDIWIFCNVAETSFVLNLTK